MLNLNVIASLVNQEVPDFRMGLHRPNEMMRIRASDCLGRAILAYTLLRSMGVSDGEMSLLVDDTHAQEYAPGRYWNGHASLLVEGGSDGLIDSVDDAYVRGRDVVLPLPAEGTATKCQIDDRPYTAYPVGEGLASYQQNHPLLINRPPVGTEDYVDVYGGLLVVRASLDL